MKLKNVAVRCGNCRYEVKGAGHPHMGVTYCSKWCREMGIDKQSRKNKMRPWGWGWVVAFCLLGAFVTGPSRPAWAHDPYSNWTIPGQSKSCCNNTDCRPTQAKFERGSWWAFIASKKIWVQIPNDRLVNYKTDDTDAHVCYGETFGEVYCFRPPFQGG